jgi:hypothetical protein
MSLQTNRGDVDFVRLRSAAYPAGQFSLRRAGRISLSGRHTAGCTLFPEHGSAVLRSDVADEKAPGVFFFWGPHSAGHQSPAALHIEMHAGGSLVNATPLSGGYEDNRHLDWVRTTIAHNTVTVDETSMFPYDLEGESIWEADSWRGRYSDGVLELFQPETHFKAVRASNQNVYPGVRLDRTVILTRNYLVDVFRALSDHEHVYDWAWHGFGNVEFDGAGETVELGGRRGYRYLTDARTSKTSRRLLNLTWAGAVPVRGNVWLDGGAEAILANEPSLTEGAVKGHLGGSPEAGPRTALLVRARARHALYVSVWQAGPPKPDLQVESVAGDATHAVEIVIREGNERTTWHAPWQKSRVLVDAIIE